MRTLSFQQLARSIGTNKTNKKTSFYFSIRITCLNFIKSKILLFTDSFSSKLPFCKMHFNLLYIFTLYKGQKFSVYFVHLGKEFWHTLNLSGAKGPSSSTSAHLPEDYSHTQLFREI